MTVKKTSLRYAMLGFLLSGPTSGYRLKQSFDATFGLAWNAHDSQIYPELRSLVRGGLAEVEEQTVSGRLTRIYTITRQGRAELRSWLVESPQPGFLRDEFLLRLFFLAELPEPDRETFLRAELERIDQELQRARDASRTYGSAGSARDPGRPLYWQLATVTVMTASLEGRREAVVGLLAGRAHRVHGQDVHGRDVQGQDVPAP
ncbi:MAG TPA: PadR family transcriptional regulator [Streptosporangiaceae bacterium]